MKRTIPAALSGGCRRLGPRRNRHRQTDRAASSRTKIAKGIGGNENSFCSCQTYTAAATTHAASRIRFAFVRVALLGCEAKPGDDAPASWAAAAPSTYRRWYKPKSAHSQPSEP